jgi:tetratricopeptide (TPR) repeat protein
VISLRPPIRWLIAALAVLTLGAAWYRYRYEARKSAPAASFLDGVRAQLALLPVLTAEAELRARPDDPGVRVRLADACARTGDGVGAALALSPLPGAPATSPEASAPQFPELGARFVHFAAQLGWLDEAEGALRRMPHPPARASLDLADASVTRGDAPRAVTVLTRLEQEAGSAMSSDEWLDGAMTWYQCRMPRHAARWARKAIAMGQGSVSPGVERGRDLLGTDRPPTPGNVPSNNRYAAVALARCLLAAGQPDAALAALQSAAPAASVSASAARSGPAATGTLPGTESVSRSGVEPLVRFWRARAELRRGGPARQQSSLEYLADLGMREPADPVAAFEAGRALLGRGRSADAVVLLTRAAREQYQEVRCDELLAEASVLLGRPERAAWARGRALLARGRLPAAQVALRQSLRLDPGLVGARLDLAKALALAGRPAEALAVLRQGRELHPSDLDLALASADTLNQLDRFDDQARELVGAVALDAGRAFEPLRNLGRMYHETRQFDRAIPVLEQALQRHEGDAEAHRLLGLTLALHPEEPVQARRALAHLLRAAQLDPGDPIQWTTAGDLLRRMGGLPEAAACYRRAILWGGWADAPYVALAQVLSRQGRSAEAALLLRLYRERRDLTRERRQWENRVGADRGSAVAHYRLGDLLFRSNSYRSAYPYLLIAASLRPDWKQAQERLADACALLDYADMWHERESDRLATGR